MATINSETWLFVVEYYDPMPMLKKKYLLKYYLESNSVEMVDLKSKKMFLKKSLCPPEIQPSDFFVGGKVLIYSRELEIIDYGDGTTRRLLQHQVQKCAAVLLPGAYQHWGRYVDAISDNMTLFQIRTIQASGNIADGICGILNETSMKRSQLLSGVSLLIIFHSENGVEIMNNILTKVMRDIGNNDVIIAGTGEQTNDIIEILKVFSI